MTEMQEQQQVPAQKMRWYVVHVYSGMEKSVQRALTERIGRCAFPEQFGEVLVPTEEVVEDADEFTEPEIETSVMEIDVIPKTEDEESVEAVEDASEPEEVPHDNQNNRKNRKNRHRK